MSNGFYRGIVEGMACGVLTVDSSGHLLTINGLARQILEIPPEETVEGRLCGEVLQHHHRLADLLLESLARSTLPNRSELRLKGRDDSEQTIGFSMSRIRDRDGTEIGAAMFFKDLTQVEQQEEQERLRDRLAALGEMAAQMAHEIRNPITSIGVTAQLLRRRLLSAGENVEAVDRISREIARIEGTIAGCLEYVRPISPAMINQSLPALLEDAATEARERKGHLPVRIELICEPGFESFPCDGPRLRQVFHNLIVNAIEAVEAHEVAEGGESAGSSGAEGIRSPVFAGVRMPHIMIFARADAESGQALIQISDNGPGIREEMRDRIFYPFFTTKIHGTGIGLAMARKIVEAHRGVIDVSGTKGEGATFSIRLPLSAAPMGFDKGALSPGILEGMIPAGR